MEYINLVTSYAKNVLFFNTYKNSPLISDSDVIFSTVMEPRLV